jgi:hypothetical protein
MDLVPIFTILREKRLFVALSLLVALGVGAFMAFGSHKYTVGIGQQNVLIDTPKSSAADLNPTGNANPGAATNLVNQADLLANLMLSATIEDNIAHQLGIPASQLLVTNSATAGVPVISTELATTAATKRPPTKAYDLTITTNPGLSILTFATQAPSAQGAASLANAATVALKSYINDTAIAQQIPASQLTVVSALGPPQAGLSQQGPKKLYAAVAAALSFLLLCSLIVFLTGRARAARLATIAPEGYRRGEGAEAIAVMAWDADGEVTEEPIALPDAPVRTPSPAAPPDEAPVPAASPPARAPLRVAAPTSAQDKALTAFMLTAAGKVSAAATEDSDSAPANPEAVKTRKVNGTAASNGKAASNRKPASSGKPASNGKPAVPATPAGELLDELLSRAGE